MDVLAITGGPALALMLVGLTVALIGSRARGATGVHAISVGCAFVAAGWAYPLALFAFALIGRSAT